MIRQISAEETHPVRQEVLRPGRPPEECNFPGDFEETTLHFGIYEDSGLIGVASFVKNKFPEFREEVQFQLRGMAVKKAVQGKGLGAELLKKGEEILLQRHHDLLLWFNAREIAIPFYQRMGYTSIGEKFMIPNVCLHIVMYKRLSPSE